MRYTEYNEYRSGRRAVFKFLDENPYHTFASMKKKLRKETNFGGLKDQTIRNYMSEWRNSYSIFGAVPRLHRGFGVLESGFDIGLWEGAPSFGWLVSRNKNRERLWHESGVSLGWHRNGTVVFRFKGFRPQGHLLGVFVRAFLDVIMSSGKSEHEVVNYLHLLFKEKYRTRGFHSTYETGQPLPKTKVTDFEKSHGLTIKLGDGSHITSIEVEQTEPFWFSKIKSIIDQLGVQIESHVALIKSWKEESEENRRTLHATYRILKQQAEDFAHLMSRLFKFLDRQEKREIIKEKNRATR